MNFLRHLAPNDWKPILRYHLKQISAIGAGYGLLYAKTHDHHGSAYEYLWSSARTSIPDRGSEETRANRVHNLETACQRIDGIVIRSHQAFSFCDRVGAPTRSNGFRCAPVFVKGKVQTDVGGGLCLLATNLFNTFLHSPCQIIERHCHSIDAYGSQRFYELGQDAAIAYGYKDLVVKNNTNTDLRLELKVISDPAGKGEVFSRLWASQPLSTAVKIATPYIEEIKPPAPNYFSGWQVSTQRWVQPLGQDWYLDHQYQSEYAPCLGS